MNRKKRNEMHIIKHYYCLNCTNHQDENVQVTNKHEVLRTPTCEKCGNKETYIDIRTYKLEDDQKPTGGVGFDGYTLGDYFDETQAPADAWLSQKTLDYLNKSLEESGIKPIPLGEQINQMQVPFMLDGNILIDHYTRDERNAVFKFLNNMKTAQTLSKVSESATTNDVNSIYPLLTDTIAEFVTDITKYDEDYTRDDFLSNVDELNLLDAPKIFNLLANHLYEASEDMLTEYQNDKTLFRDQFILILQS